MTPTLIAELIGDRRLAKACALADVLTMHGTDAATARTLPKRGRRLVALLADVPVPSDDTWSLVCDLLD